MIAPENSITPGGVTATKITTNSNRLILFLFFIAIIAATVLRLVDPAVRPLHSDEGGNYWFIKEVLETGCFPYSHENYHGPLFFYLSAIPVMFLGYSEASLRLFSALSGVALCFMPLLFNRSLGLLTAVISSLFLALSPSLIFYSRDSIHEMFFVLSGLVLAATVFRWISEGGRKWIFASAAAAAAMVTTKETFVITFAAIFVAVMSSFSPRRIFDSVYPLRRVVGIASAWAAIGVFLIYSAGGRWTRGIIELGSALQQWIGRGTTSDTGHFKVWSYYVADICLPAEPWLLAAIPLAVLLLIQNRKLAASGRNQNYSDPRQTFLICWRYLTVFAVAQIAIYSAIPYKTPWLVVGLTAPCILVFGCLIGWLIAPPKNGPAEKGRLLTGGFVTCGLVACSLFQGIGYNFAVGEPWMSRGFRPYGETNPFSYVHTDPQMLEAVQRIFDYKSTHPHSRILIGAAGYWPLPFYLREFDPDTAYFVPDSAAAYAEEYDVLLLDSANEWRDPRFEEHFYRLSDFQQGRLFLKLEAAP